MSSKVRVLVLDDNPDLRSLLRSFLELADEGFEVVASAGISPDVVSDVRGQPPDVVVLDVLLSGAAGLEVAKQVIEMHPHVPVVMFGGSLHPTVTEMAERIGIRVCVEHIGALPAVLVEQAAHRRVAGSDARSERTALRSPRFALVPRVRGARSWTWNVQSDRLRRLRQTSFTRTRAS
jgi:DNA-binding NarL/FixJ family response regulator